MTEALTLLTPWNSGIELLRVGGDRDGGYLIPNDLEEVEALLSPGVAETWDFERDIGNRFGIRSYMIDGSVDAPEGLTDLQRFDPLWLGTESRRGVVSLRDWVGDVTLRHSGDLILQMDIEGAEYRVLASTPLQTLRRFRIIGVEFHGLDWMRLAFAMRGRILPALRRLAVDFDVVHVHPNNCCGTFTILGVTVPRVLEVTYLRRDRFRGEHGRANLPSDLDQDCVQGLPSIRLPRSWPFGD